MKIIIIGYGRVGTQVVRLLRGKKHHITVIDKSRAAVAAAENDPDLELLVGDAVDPDMLHKADAEHADVLMALTREENTNLMATLIAKVAFNVPRTIAMVYDPSREHSFRAAGIETLPITIMGAEAIVEEIGCGAAVPQAGRDISKEAPLAEPVPRREIPPRGPYYIVVLGGGKVGFYLARTLLEEGHEITIIESDPEIYSLVSRQIDCPVLLGDGSTYDVLERAGAGRCNVFVAVTNHDQDNLIACQVARREFGVPKTIARVKNPKNEKIMQQLGVDTTVSSTAIISSLIQSELPIHKIRQLLNLRAGQLEIMEYVLDGKSPVVGQQLKDLTMPPNCNIVTILRDGTAVVPRGDTSLQSEDMVLALTDEADEPRLRKLLLG